MQPVSALLHLRCLSPVPTPDQAGGMCPMPLVQNSFKRRSPKKSAVRVWQTRNKSTDLLKGPASKANLYTHATAFYFKWVA
eukprot:11194880-Alexandrium_andersonii.AAC.1